MKKVILPIVAFWFSVGPAFSQEIATTKPSRGWLADRFTVSAPGETWTACRFLSLPNLQINHDETERTGAAMYYVEPTHKDRRSRFSFTMWPKERLQEGTSRAGDWRGNWLGRTKFVVDLNDLTKDPGSFSITIDGREDGISFVTNIWNSGHAFDVTPSTIAEQSKLFAILENAHFVTFSILDADGGTIREQSFDVSNIRNIPSALKETGFRCDSKRDKRLIVQSGDN